MLPSAKSSGQAPPPSPSIQAATVCLQTAFAVPVDFPPGSDCNQSLSQRLLLSLFGVPLPLQRPSPSPGRKPDTSAPLGCPIAASPHPRRLLSRRVCGRSRPHHSSFPPPSPASLSLSRLEARRICTASQPDSSSAYPRRLLSRHVCGQSRPDPSSFPPPSPASLSLSRPEARRVCTASRPDSSSASHTLSSPDALLSRCFCNNSLSQQLPLSVSGIPLPLRNPLLLGIYVDNQAGVPNKALFRFVSSTDFPRSVGVLRL